MTQADKPFKIAFISCVVLILELAFIRQVPAEVRSISYFTNLILMSGFFGLGLGCLLQRYRSIELLLPIGVISTFSFIFSCRGLVVFDESLSVHYWLEPPSGGSRAMTMPLFLSAALAFFVTALPFIALGQKLAQTMEAFPRLVAYGWDIAGSLLGTIIFAVSSYLEIPPWIWPLVVTVTWSLIFYTNPLKVALFGLSGVTFFFLANSENPSRWSPYYYVQFQKEAEGMRVWVNSSFHQLMLDLSGRDSKTAQQMKATVQRFSYPYEIYRQHHAGNPPQKVLILGAGTGNDVNIALMNGAQSITTVEIDPVIASLGRQHNTLRPYSSPRVALIVDDARHYLESTTEKFDLVVFGTLDSQTLLSGIANLRLENYVYTVEAMEAARARLVEGGMVVLYYSVFKPWLFERIYATVAQVFPESVQMLVYTQSQFLFNTVILAGHALPQLQKHQEQNNLYAHALASRDDWPFLYLERPTIAPIYRHLMLSIFAITLIAFVVLRRMYAGSGWQLSFLFLGMGFTLMESAAVVRFALLFGSTWVVNAVVFSSVLLMIFLANLAVIRNWAPQVGVAGVCLVTSVLMNYYVPLHKLLQFSVLIRACISGLLVGVPVFFAAICFSRLFALQKHTGNALGVNLIGAMCGGFIEYISMLYGLKFVWVVIAGIYALAILTKEKS